jgi:hypothetical protein
VARHLHTYAYTILLLGSLCSWEAVGHFFIWYHLTSHSTGLRIIRGQLLVTHRNEKEFTYGMVLVVIVVFFYFRTNSKTWRCSWTSAWARAGRRRGTRRAAAGSSTAGSASNLWQGSVFWPENSTNLFPYVPFDNYFCPANIYCSHAVTFLPIFVHFLQYFPFSLQISPCFSIFLLLTHFPRFFLVFTSCPPNDIMGPARLPGKGSISYTPVPWGRIVLPILGLLQACQLIASIHSCEFPTH